MSYSIYGASIGNLACLEYVFNLGFSGDKYACHSAIDYPECLEFLIEHGCEVDSLLGEMIAEKGNLKSLEILHQHNCLLNQESLRKTMENNHLECFKYLIDNGYGNGNSIYEEAIKYEKFDYADYILEKNIKLTSGDKDAIILFNLKQNISESVVVEFFGMDVGNLICSFLKFNIR